MTTFPKDFLWSASTAATQIEGGWNADGTHRPRRERRHIH